MMGRIAIWADDPRFNWPYAAAQAAGSAKAPLSREGNRA